MQIREHGVLRDGNLKVKIDSAISTMFPYPDTHTHTHKKGKETFFLTRNELIKGYWKKREEKKKPRRLKALFQQNEQRRVRRASERGFNSPTGTTAYYKSSAAVKCCWGWLLFNPSVKPASLIHPKRPPELCVGVTTQSVIWKQIPAALKKKRWKRFDFEEACSWIIYRATSK